jgi:thiamine biosynthesis lipoprotein
MTSSLDRRQFLQPRQLAHATGATLGALDTLSSVPGHGVPSILSLLSVSRRAMACTFEMLLPVTAPRALDAATAALDEIDRLEAQLTVYRESSEINRLNRLAHHGPVPVERRLFDLLALSAALSEKTEGSFDITAGALIKCWGFYRGPRRVPSPEELASARQRVGMRHVVIDPGRRTVHYECHGLEINLGSIGKGYALDQVAELLREDWDLTAGLVHGGYSSVFALGAPAHDPRGWTVGICDPRDPAYRVAAVRLRDRALGTSAVTFQHLEYQGRKLGHILDPRTGWPAEGMLSVSVAAPTAAEADALATAFFILGTARARVYCEAQPEIGALLIPQPQPGEPLNPILIGNLEAEVYAGPVALSAGQDEGDEVLN